MAINCKIIFDKNPAKVFYVDQSLRGYVRLAVEKEQVINGIYVKVSGVATAKWQHGRGIRRCREDCLSHQMSLKVGETRCIAKTYRFPFQFKLPSQLPSSFEGEFGSVRYTVIVTIEFPLELNKELVESITILKMIDANDPDLQRKVSVCDRFNPYFAISCIPWFPISIDAHVEPGTYAPGAMIDIGINVTNKSFRRVRNFVVQLIKEVTYSSYDQSQKKQSIAVLNEIETRGCNQNQKHPICLGCQLKVPQTSPSDSASIIIKVRHFIRITANMGKNYRPVLELPVTIITISEFRKKISFITN